MGVIFITLWYMIMFPLLEVKPVKHCASTSKEGAKALNQAYFTLKPV